MEMVRKYSYVEINFSSDAGVMELPHCGKVTFFGSQEEEVLWLNGFYKAPGEYGVRIYAPAEGRYVYEIETEKETITGEFLCQGASENSHGRVFTKGDGFIYEDGTRYFPFGTTCYAWTHQSNKLQETTLETLSHSCFNKIRMLLFPKHMPYNEEDPEIYPFEKREDGSFDVNRIVPAYWDNLDLRIQQLAGLGIEADLILFHPYDKWGFSCLPQEDALTYVKYCIARLSAFPNVWWSLANEYDMLVQRTPEDWDQYGSLLAQKDPYQHLISIHQMVNPYPKKDWMTHISMQTNHIDFLPVWKERYQLPIIIDECRYEGNIEEHWGNQTAFAMVDCFWRCITQGGYCTHGETFYHEDQVLWWSKGGKLYGESEPRIAFLKNLLESLPGCGTKVGGSIYARPEEGETPEIKAQQEFFYHLVQSSPVENMDELLSGQRRSIATEEWILQYYDSSCPAFSWWYLPEGNTYDLTLIDVWEMTEEVILSDACGKVRVPLPAHPGMAVLARKK